jgi:hypothetical protein
MPAKGCLGAVAAALMLLTTGAAPSPAPAVLTDAAAIFNAARKAWGSGAYPRYAQYAVVVSFQNGEQHVRRTWDTSEDLRGGVIYSRSFSREENANPFTPHGIDIVIPFAGAIDKEKRVDPLGQVEFAVDQDYGLAPGQRKFVPAQNAGQVGGDSSHLATIGRTATVSRDYAVTLLETRSDEKGPEYHLALTPLRDAWHHRLRELWVDGATMLPEEAVVEGIGDREPLTKVKWRVEFTQLQGGSYIARETALAPLDCGDDGSLTGVSVSFEELQLTSHPRGAGFGLGVVSGKPQSEPGS